MQILISNIGKSIRNLKSIQTHVSLSFDLSKPFALAIIEPPKFNVSPEATSILENFFPKEICKTHLIKSKPIQSTHSKIIFIHNMELFVTESNIIKTVENHEESRCLGIDLIINGIPHNLFIIHGLDLINYQENEFERHICEYNIYKQIREAAQNKPTIVTGDFNGKIGSSSLNNKRGLNASIDNNKTSSFLNLTPNLVENCKKKYSNANEIRGSFYFSSERYSETKWHPLDQLLISKQIDSSSFKNFNYISTLKPDIDLVYELKKNKSTEKSKYFDHLPIHLEFQ